MSIVVDRFQNLSGEEVRYEARYRNELSRYVGHGKTDVEAIIDLKNRVKRDLLDNVKIEN